VACYPQIWAYCCWTTHFPRSPRRIYYDGLPCQPWYGRSAYPALSAIASQLEQHAKEISYEYRKSGVMNKMERYSSSTDHGLEADEWAGLTLWERHRFNDNLGSVFPRTQRVLQELQAHLFPLTGEVVFLRLRPGTEVPLHHDSTNLQLTAHLGVSVPSDCGIQVGGESRRWKEGEVIFFDHSFHHRVWNHSDTRRPPQDQAILNRGLHRSRCAVFTEYARVWVIANAARSASQRPTSRRSAW
jgi:hypothetical protein